MDPVQLIGDLLRARAPISSMASILKVRLSRMRNEDVRAMFLFFPLSLVSDKSQSPAVMVLTRVGCAISGAFLP